MSKKPLIIFIAICWMIAFIGIFLMKDMEYRPMPGQYQFTIKNNLEEEK